jgi:hypothetical protein
MGNTYHNPPTTYGVGWDRILPSICLEPIMLGVICSC